jgi:hypothetical protein
MRPVPLAFAVAALAVLAISMIPVFAYTPLELLSDKDVAIDCDEKTKVCKVSQADLEWMFNRDKLLNRMLGLAGQQLRNCGVKGV